MMVLFTPNKIIVFRNTFTERLIHRETRKTQIYQLVARGTVHTEFGAQAQKVGYAQLYNQSKQLERHI